MDRFPTPLLLVLNALFGLGLVLVLVGVFFVESDAFRAAVGTFLGGAGCVLAVADVWYFLAAGRGYGRLSSHITREKSPVGFGLHIVLRLIFFVLWGSLFVAGLRSFG